MIPLRALLVEDCDDDVALVAAALRAQGYAPELRVVDDAAALAAALEGGDWDVVLSDYAMPQFSGFDALRLVRERGVDTPFILISGTIGEELAVEAMHAGADDYILKDNLTRLGPAIQRELREAAVRAARRRSEEEREAALLALRRSQRELRAVVERAPDGMVIHRDRVLAYANPVFAGYLGVTDPAALVGADLLDLVVPHDRGRAARGFEATSGEVCQVEVQRPDGERRTLELSGAVPIELEGEPSTLTMCRDVTHRNKLQEQLLVSDRMASVGILAAGVAHEINNPLAAAMINVDLASAAIARLRAELGVPELAECAEMLADAREAAQRVREIVRDLKMFSRVEEEQRGPVQIHRMLDATLRMAWNEIRHRARLIKDYGPVPCADASEARLAQVFLNLVVNAAQAIPEGQADRNEIRVLTRTDEQGRAVVEVRDTGVGMSEDVKKRLFVPFFTTKPVGEGTGLGLSICSRIVSALGGEIAIESELGKGTVFRVSLPAASGRTSRPPPPDEAAPSIRRGRVLIIDDELAVGRALQRGLRETHDVTLTHGAKDALQRIRAGARFDVILCDLMMPDVTGMELFAELERDAPDQARRVVFVTGGAFTARARAFLDEVPNLCLEKPLNVQHLLRFLQDRLRA